MDPEEMEKALGVGSVDPELDAKMRAYAEEHPEVVEEFDRTERAMLTLVEREDFQHLLLSRDEVEPWIWLAYQQLMDAGGSMEGTDADAVAAMFHPVLSEMVDSIFTAERREEFLVRLQEYREQRSAAGDDASAAYAISAIISIQNGGKASESIFLYALCHRSMRAVAQELAEEDAAGD